MADLGEWMMRSGVMLTLYVTVPILGLVALVLLVRQSGRG